MIDNESKMPIVLVGNSFKYEVEAVCKLFFHTARFAFFDDMGEVSGEEYILAEQSCKNGEIRLRAAVRMRETEPAEKEENLPADTETSVLEHELCRMLFNILSGMTGIVPPWGLMTGIRPVKKFTELMEEGKSREEIYSILTEKYQLLPEKFSQPVCIYTLLSDEMQLLFICITFDGFCHKAHAGLYKRTLQGA